MCERRNEKEYIEREKKQKQRKGEREKENEKQGRTKREKEKREREGEMGRGVKKVERETDKKQVTQNDHMKNDFFT